MRICLIDADSTIPNLALMKLSSYYKSRGDHVSLFKANLPYYPNKKKNIFKAPFGFDKYHCSVIFQGNKDYILGDDIDFGGTGFSLSKNLPEHIERINPDYSLYPKNNMSYGFLSRGCIRNCSFCFVPQKEGGIRQVNNVDDIVQHKSVRFMDNNFLALPNHKELLQELVDKDIRCQFNQGLDIRLVDDENSVLLSKLNYIGEYIFAFDDIKYRQTIEGKLDLLSWRKPWRLKFFVYCHPDMTISDTVDRVLWLRKKECLPYLMRDISCWNSINSDFYVDIASWCNQPNIFKKLSFDQFLQKRHKNKDRIEKSYNLYNK